MNVDQHNRLDEPETDSASPVSEETRTDSGPAALEHLLEDLDALREALVLYLNTRQDQWKLRARRMAIGAALALLGLFIGAVLLGISICVTVLGLAGGLGELFDGRYWLGELVTGLCLISLVGLGLFLFVRSLQTSSRRRTIERYARLRKQKTESSSDGSDVRT